ncbi:MAG: hypothetical protein HYX27_10005 [Acidobacteria bacterium]|nr:hypothetical protein [Acidobacteriota bacterium]
MFAVWEPILPTDWSAPGTSALHRLNDRRVRQFWDPGHLVAAAIKKAEASGQLHPECCEREGFLWDLSAAYAPGARWNDRLPEPVLLSGPVVEVAAALESVVAKDK